MFQLFKRAIRRNPANHLVILNNKSQDNFVVGLVRFTKGTKYGET